ncbi:MAG: hypothetical protein OXC63_13735 [Aestuariivita sp.]|nr:hypothetical protein [Aestuariivita sp.]MCY4347198.1 hypothetical protein [Aestuariivita sp.]
MLPVIPLAVVATAIAAYGTKKTVDTVYDHSEASDLNDEAKRLLKKAEQRLGRNRGTCKKQLEDLGLLKLKVWDRQLGRFAALFKKIHRIEVKGTASSDTIQWTQDNLVEMKKLSGYANEMMVLGAAGSVSSAVLVRMASYGGASVFAPVLTGTSITALGGVAGTNATLAWLGGGSLVAGVGMAGSMAVLGGIVAAPVLAIGGVIFAAKARENLATARKNHALAKEHEAKLNAATVVVVAIHDAALQVQEVIEELNERITPVLDELAQVIAENGTDFSRYPESAQQTVYLSTQFAQCLKTVLEAPLLTKKGTLETGYREALKSGQKLLGENGRTSKHKGRRTSFPSTVNRLLP